MVAPNVTEIHATAPPPGAGEHGDRGRIYGLSSAARRRLLVKIGRLELRGLFVTRFTLTYHREDPGEPVDWYRDLHAFHMALQRDWPRHYQAAITVKEFQRRGTVHFHQIVVWKVLPVKAQLIRWLSDTWNRIAEPGDEAHRKAGTRVDYDVTATNEDLRRMMRYFAKYLGKRHQKRREDEETGELHPTGRMWYDWGDLPQTVLLRAEIEPEDLIRLERRIRKWRKASRYASGIGRRYHSAVLIEDAGAFMQLLRGIPLQTGPPT